MKKTNKLIAVWAVLCMLFSNICIAQAETKAEPFKEEFNTEGYVPKAADGYAYSGSGSLSVNDGVLTLANSTASGNKNAHQLTLSFAPVSSGVLVVEGDVITVNTVASDKGLFTVLDSSNNVVANVAMQGRGASSSMIAVNGATDWNSRINNASWQGTKRVKFVIDFATKTYTAWQGTPKTGGYNWTQMIAKNNSDKSITSSEFAFTAEDASKLRINLTENGDGIDNIKVYKEITATQGASNYNMLVGDTRQAEITYSPSGETMGDMVWSTSDDSVADVDSNGLITAKSNGTAEITASSNFYDVSFKYDVNVTVPATDISLNKTTAELCVGDNLTLGYGVVPDNATPGTISWLSSDSSVATVDSNGVVTGVGKGTATITVNGSVGVFASCTVSVVIPLTGLTISNPDTTLAVGESVSLTAAAVPSDASATMKKWRSGNHFVATVDQYGRVTAVAPGKVQIYVSCANLYASANITVLGSERDNAKSPLVSFVEVGSSFADIADIEWAQSAVQFVAAEGILLPDSETQFGAKRNIKRDELVSAVIKSLNLSNKKAKKGEEIVKTFDDVNESNPYYAEIMKAVELGIIEGVSDTSFAPDLDITRQDMAVVIERALEVASIETVEGRLDFADKADIADYAQKSVRVLSKMGIIVGKDIGFDPLANTTRAETAVICERIIALR